MNTPNTSGSSLESQAAKFEVDISSRYRTDSIFKTLTWLAISIALLVLATLIVDVLFDGLPFVNWDFLTNFPSRKPERAGLLSALAGTIWVMVTVAVIAFPLGVGAGIFLEEFAEDNWFTRAIEININNLAGVPSIIYGLLGLQVFVRVFGPNGWFYELTLAIKESVYQLLVEAFGNNSMLLQWVYGLLTDADGQITGVDITGGRSIITGGDRKSTRLNSSHQIISYAVFCLKKKKYILTAHV